MDPTFDEAKIESMRRAMHAFIAKSHAARSAEERREADMEIDVLCDLALVGLHASVAKP